MADDGFTVLDMGQELELAKKATPVEVVHVPVGKIVPNPYQPRKTFEEESLLDLASSIRQYGVLQPLLVAPYENGNYLLISKFDISRSSHNLISGFVFPFFLAGFQIKGKECSRKISKIDYPVLNNGRSFD